MAGSTFWRFSAIFWEAMVHLKVLRGAEIEPYLDELARLRIAVFREFPYLYDGSLDYEKNYLQTYLRIPEAVLVLAQDGARVVGASTGLPLEVETPEIQQPWRAAGYDPTRIFYFAESVLLPPYRGQGIGLQFMQQRQAHALSLPDRTRLVFCAVVRPEHLRPVDYVPLHAFWERFGFRQRPEMYCYMKWKDLTEEQETTKKLVFWEKEIGERNRSDSGR